MGQTGWGERFLSTTRGRIVGLLRRGPRTVNELAEVLELTDNAVRGHLATLERDGLVRQAGARAGTRRPHLTYELTPDAGELFPKPYAAVLQELLAVLAARLSEAELGRLLRQVGARLADGFKGDVRAPDVRGRTAEAAAVLGELGGMAEVEEAGGALVIRGFDCPLGGVVEEHPVACRVAEALLSELIGAPVAERCQHGHPPRCAFDVAVRPEGG